LEEDGTGDDDSGNKVGRNTEDTIEHAEKEVHVDSDGDGKSDIGRNTKDTIGNTEEASHEGSEASKSLLSELTEYHLEAGARILDAIDTVLEVGNIPTYRINCDFQADDVNAGRKMTCKSWASAVKS